MGGGGKSSTSTSSVTIPPEVLARYNSVNATAEQVAQTPFQQYSTDPNAFVAPINSTQQAGINQIANSANAAQPYYGAATGLTMAGAGPANLGGLNTGQYISPFLGSVYGTALAGQSQQNAQQQSNLAGQAITSGAFGGDRSNIAQANLAYQQNLANNQTNANLLNTGYQNAQSVAQQQQGAQLAAQQANLARLTGAGQQLAGLGAGVQTAAQTGGQNVLAAGTVPQQTQQAGLTALYNQFLQQQAYPFQTAQFLANIAEGTGALSGSTTTTTQPSSFFSDRRLKHDIKKIGETKDGLPIYKFKYKGDPTEQTHIGFMAQDVEKVHPEAVGMSHGYKTVDYDKATEGRHHRYAGGLIPNHMGGPVSEGHAGEEYARGGYALDGAVVDPTDLKAILAAQQQMYAPFAQNGMNISGVPGAGKGIVPAANLPVPKLVTSNFKPQQQQSGLQQLSSAANQLNSSGDTAQGLWNKGVAAKNWLEKPSSNDNSSESNPNTTVSMGNNVNMKQAEMPQQYDDPNQVSGQYRGGLVREHHMYGNSVGDGSDMPYDDQKGYMGSLGLGSAQQLSPQQLQSEQKDMSEGRMPSQPPSGAAQMIKGATDIYSLGKGASGLYDKAMSALKSVTGTPAADAAAKTASTSNAGLAGAADKAAATSTEGLGKAVTSDTLAPSAASTAAAPVTKVAADVAAPAVADAATAGATDVAAAAAPEAVADLGLGAAADAGLDAAAELAPVFLFANRGGVIPREHHDGPNDTNNQSNVVGDGQTDTTDQPQYKIQPQDLEDMPDYKQDVIRTIYNGESGGKYNILNGNISTFDTNGPHPNIIGKNGQSTAAGAGQFLNSTWNDVTGGAPMTKGYQDAATWQLASQDYFKRTGRDLDTDVQEKGFSPEIKKVLSPTWTSLQTTGQKIGNAISGGLSGAKNFVSDIISPSPANAQTLNQQGGQQQQGTDWEKIVVPLLSGIGGMANSNSRYLGAAILQGLGAGANAYENVLTNQASRPGVQAQSQSYEIGALNNLMNSWQNYRVINGTNISLQDYAKMIGYKGGIPNQQINSNINGAVGKTNAVSGNGQQYNYSIPEMQTATISRNGTNIPAFNDPFYLSQFIAHNSASINQNVINAVKAAQTQLASINSTGTSIGEGGYTPAPGALSTRRQSDVSNAITQNITNQYNSAREFEANYDQTNQLLKYAAEYSRLANMNVATPELANAIGKLRSIPGFDKYIKPDMATTQGATNALTKNAVLSAFQTLQENAGPAQKAVLQEANQVVAHPELSPEARYEIITGAQAKLDREHARNQAWISNADPKTGNYPEPLSFFQQWDQQSQNSPDAFAKQAREKIPPFAGQTKILSTNSPVQQFTPEVGKIYIDANGNRARWNGSNYVKVQ
jgi:muramidase (phage lysozyme)